MPRGTIKRLIVLSDGTWQSPDSKCPTNILKIAKALKPESDDGVQTVVYYESGVGTGGCLDSITGGGMGAGLGEKIKDIYIWLVCNYNDGDEIYLFGFSRGSYTVRSLAGFIHNCGLVRREEINVVTDAYAIYRDHDSPDRKPKGSKAKEFWMAHCCRPKNSGTDVVPVMLLACFDTVGALGLPGSSLLAKLFDQQYTFHDMHLSPDIKHAVYMLSIDETRGGFEPTMMIQSKKEQLTQLFFPGRHSGVGGGEPTEVDLSNLALNFLVGELQRREIKLEFDEDLLEEGSANVDPPVVSWTEWGKNGLMNLASGKCCVRQIASVHDCHAIVGERYMLQEGWRPEALKKLGEDLARCAQKHSKVMGGKKREAEEAADGSSASSGSP